MLFYIIQNFENNQQFQTPKETIKGVDLNYDDLDKGIMSITRDINNLHNKEESINEKVILTL